MGTWRSTATSSQVGSSATTPGPTSVTAQLSAITTTTIASPPSQIATAAAGQLIDVKMYLLAHGRIAVVHRQVTGPAVLPGALGALLAGPSAGEPAQGISTDIPAGTQLLDVSLLDGTATINTSWMIRLGSEAD